MKKFWKEFKAFISRGSVVDMAVGVIIASAFTAIVTAVTNKIIMPLINYLLLLITGGNGLDQVYTYLKWVESDTPGVVDLEKSIYIDWGALITAIINFILIALILFLILKAFNAAREGMNKAKKDMPTREERKQLKAMGVNLKNIKLVIEKTAEIRAEKKAKEEAEAAANKKPTTDELLTDILAELKKNNEKWKCSYCTFLIQTFLSF